MQHSPPSFAKLISFIPRQTAPMSSSFVRCPKCSPCTQIRLKSFCVYHTMWPRYALHTRQRQQRHEYDNVLCACLHFTRTHASTHTFVYVYVWKTIQEHTFLATHSGRYPHFTLGSCAAAATGIVLFLGRTFASVLSSARLTRSPPSASWVVVLVATLHTHTHTYTSATHRDVHIIYSSNRASKHAHIAAQHM